MAHAAEQGVAFGAAFRERAAEQVFAGQVDGFQGQGGLAVFVDLAVAQGFVVFGAQYQDQGHFLLAEAVAQAAVETVVAVRFAGDFGTGREQSQGGEAALVMQADVQHAQVVFHQFGNLQVAVVEFRFLFAFAAAQHAVIQQADHQFRELGRGDAAGVQGLTQGVL